MAERAAALQMLSSSPGNGSYVRKDGITDIEAET
jgi:hypothetical protein